MKLLLKYKKVVSDAIGPTKAHDSDAGFDLYSCEDSVFEPHGTNSVRLGIVVKIPKGYSAEIRPRSGMSLRSPLKCVLGTIDNGYRGEIKAIFFNTSDQPVHLPKGSKIVQLVIRRDTPIDVLEDENIDDETDRGTNGFGSTGK